jgi:hypothetical protein
LSSPQTELLSNLLCEAEFIRPLRSRQGRFTISDCKSHITDNKSSNLKFAICNAARSAALLPAFVFGEVVVHGGIAFESPDSAFFAPVAVENRFKKGCGLAPGGPGL